MARLDLLQPDAQVFSTNHWDGKGNKQALDFKLRVFTYADCGFLLKAGGADWLKKILAGDSGLAVKILAHQIENTEEVEAILGGAPEDKLPKLIQRDSNSALAVLKAITDLYNESQPEVWGAKKMRMLLLWLSKRGALAALMILLACSFGVGVGYSATILSVAGLLP